MTKEQATIVFEIALTRCGEGIADIDEFKKRYQACNSFGRFIDEYFKGEQPQEPKP